MKNTVSSFIILLLAGLAFTSCGTKPKAVQPTISNLNPVPANPVKLPQNMGYTAPTVAAIGRNNVSYLPSNIAANKKVSWSRGTSTGKYIALTFDDGPVSSNTTRVLNMLKARNIKATFYVIGSRVKNNPTLMRRMVAEGHEVGNHTWTHRKLTTMSNAMVRSELNRTRDAIITATGVKPRTMRPPYGALLTNQRNWIFREYGYPTILWDVDPEDWRKPGATVIKNRILAQTKAGSIILLHDLHKSSVDATPAVLDALLRRGYKFVTVSQLIAMSQ